jgi:HK97 family phage major capsid protein
MIGSRREFEDILHDELKLSKTAAKKLAAGGWPALAGAAEANCGRAQGIGTAFQERKLKMELAQITAALSERDEAIKGLLAERDKKIETLQAELTEIAQKVVRRGGGGDFQTKTWGGIVTESDRYKAFVEGGCRGSARIQVKAITTGALSAGPLGPADRIATPDMLPRRRVRVRDLLAPGRTTSTSIEYPRQTTRTNNASVVSETAQKPESDMAFETVNTPVRTIAHWVPVSRQAMDDAPALQSIIDAELRYGLADVEEDEILNGDGTGVHLDGLIPNATAYAAPFAVESETMIDRLLLALAQLEAENYEPDGIVVNPLDWRKILALKTSDGAYLANGPFGAEQIARLWTLPVAPTQAIAVDSFLVGTFKRGAQLFDRLEPEVLVSSEDRDNFIKNMLTVRAEERVALAIFRPGAFVIGDFGNVT